MSIAAIARRLAVLLPLAGIVLAADPTAPVAQQRVGVNSAVNPAATGTPPGGQARQLVVGQDILYNEHIRTTEGGQTQLLFVDESAMTVGPNSEVTIDEFVYDPNTATGKMAMSASRGVLRYIGGHLSKQDGAVTLRAENAVVAVRGGAFIADQTPGGRLDIYFIYGNGVTVTGTNGAAETVRRAGYAITVPSRGASPSAPYLAPAGSLARLSAQLDGRSGANGGASRPPTEAAVANSGIATDISANLPASVQQADQNRATLATRLATVNPATIQASAQINTVQNQGSAIIQRADSGTQSTLPQTPPTPTPPTPPAPTTVTITYAGLVKNIQDPSLGFVNQDANHRTPYTNGTLTYPVGQPQQGVFNVTLPTGVTVTSPLAPGTNSVQGNSSQGPFTATTFLSPDQTFFYANATGSGTNSAGSNNGVAFIFGGTPVNQSFYQPTATNQFYTFNVQPDAALQTAIPYVPAQFGGNTPNAQVSPLLLVTAANNQFGGFSTTNQNVTSPRWLQSSIAFNGAGASQTSVFTVNTGDFFTSADTGTVVGAGIVRGSFQANGAAPIRLGSSTATVPDGNNNNLFGTNTITGFVLDQNNYNTSLNFNQALAAAVPLGQTATNYAFNQPVVAAGVPAVGSRTSQTTTGFFGGVMYPNVPGGTSPAPYALLGSTGVTTNAVTNRVQATFAGTDPFTSAQSGVGGVVLQFGSLSGQSFARNAFIDDTRYAALESPTNASAIVTPGNTTTTFPTTPGGTFTPRLAMVTAATVNNALPNGVTACACQYLQWGYWTGELDTPNSTQTATSRVDRASINTWLAGIPTAASDISALHSQAFIGNYSGQAVGSVVNNGVGYVAAGGFNGSYNFGTNVGTATISNFDGRTLTGTVGGSGGSYAGSFAAPGVRGIVQGQFFGPMAAETGGSFGIQATNYLASGIFAGKR